MNRNVHRGGVRPLYVLSHGWGFDAGFWDGVRARLPDEDVAVLDWGYFGELTSPVIPAKAGIQALQQTIRIALDPGLRRGDEKIPENHIITERANAEPPPGRPLIAVGHSYGAMQLLQLAGMEWSGFVAVNGFARFSQADDYPGARRRVIDQMLKRFDQDPAAVLADFRARCGAAEPPPPGLDVQRLRAGLEALRDDDARDAAAALDCPALLLAGDADPIVSPETTRASAGCFRHATVEWLAGGGHLSPRLAPDWCVGHLTAFAARLTGE